MGRQAIVWQAAWPSDTLPPITPKKPRSPSRTSFLQTLISWSGGLLFIGQVLDVGHCLAALLFYYSRNRACVKVK